jgi:hypothetical protein
VPDERPAGRRRALLIATATYSDPGLAALRAPTGDVAALAGVLGDEAIGGFEVRELIDRPTEGASRRDRGVLRRRAATGPAAAVRLRSRRPVAEPSLLLRDREHEAAVAALDGDRGRLRQ